MQERRLRGDDENSNTVTKNQILIYSSQMKPQGFNLIELLIVMAMMAILVALAYPNYQSYLRDAKRRRAEVELVRLSEGMNEYYSQYGTYLGATLANFGIDSAPYYQFKIATLEAQSYLINAIPLGSQTEDNCGILSINEKGIRAAKQKNCW